MWISEGVGVVQAAMQFIWLALVASAAVYLLATASRLRRRETSKDWTQNLGTERAQVDSIQPLNNFEWWSEEPSKIRPFKPTYHITMGLRTDTASDLIIIDKNYADRIKLRKEIIRDHGQTVHGCLPSGLDAVREVYTFLLGEFLVRRFPGMFRLSEDGKVFHNLQSNCRYPVAPPEDGNEALRIIAETVEEDMFLLHETPDGHFSDAFVCCFAAGFDPSKKLGKLLKDIHAPVPSYEKIGPSMERFFSKLEVGKSVKRTNWSIQTHGRMFNGQSHDTPEDAVDSTADEKFDMSNTYVRVELQTLTRLPQTLSILFSFKTYMYPIADIKEEGLGEELTAAIRGLKRGNAPGMWVYKGSTKWAEQVCEFLTA